MTTKLKLSDVNFVELINNYKDDDFMKNYKDETRRDIESLSLRNVDSSATILPMAKSVIFRGDGSLQKSDRLRVQKSHFVLDPYARH